MCTRTGGGRAGDLQSKDPLPTLRSSARSILHAEVVNIYFIDEATDTLWCSSEGDEISPYKQEVRMRMGEGLVGKSAAAQIPMTWTFASLEELQADKDAGDDPSLKVPPFVSVRFITTCNDTGCD